MLYVLRNLKLNALVRNTSGKPLTFNTDKAATAMLKRWGADVRDYQVLSYNAKHEPKAEDGDEPALDAIDFAND